MTQEDKFEAAGLAHTLSESLKVSAYLEGHSDHDAKYHLDRAHENFAKLADMMGYTVTKKGGA